MLNKNLALSIIASITVTISSALYTMEKEDVLPAKTEKDRQDNKRLAEKMAREAEEAWTKVIAQQTHDRAHSLAALTQNSKGTLKDLAPAMIYKSGRSYISFFQAGLKNINGISKLYIDDKGHVVPITEVIRIFLDLTDNLLTSLPAEIGHIKRIDTQGIVWLSISGNLLKGLPDSLKHLQNLTQLSADSNEFTSIPTVIASLKKLQCLSLEKNPIERVTNLDDLPELTALNLQSCKLVLLSEDFGNLQALKSLYLAYNRLRQLPDSFSALQNLESVQLRYNNFEEIPRVLAKLPNLRSFCIPHNPTEYPETFYELHQFISPGFYQRKSVTAADK